MCVTETKTPKKPSTTAGCTQPAGGKTKNCPVYKLVSITVKSGTAKTTDVAKNWAAVKHTTDVVIIEATTTPNSAAGWNQISWSGDSGEAVPGHPNQRKLSRKSSKHFHVGASLGGVSDHVDVWIIWADVTIKTTGNTPANAAQTGATADGTEKLGSISFNGGKEAVGKIIAVGKISLTGIHNVVKTGWKLKRERISHDWNDGAKASPGNGASDYWNTSWVDDTSYASWLKLTPDNKDQIYDNDSPNIANFGTNDAETYNNFRQWVEWKNDKCSDNAEWYWKGRWKKSKNPQVTLYEVGTGNIALPADSHFHP